MKKNRWIAFLCVCGLLCGVLCACGDARPTESKPSSASTTTSSATTTTTTSATTTAPTVTTTTTTSATTSRQVHTTSRTTTTTTTRPSYVEVDSATTQALPKEKYPPVNQRKCYVNYLGERVLVTFKDGYGLDDVYYWSYYGTLSNGYTLTCKINAQTQKVRILEVDYPKYPEVCGIVDQNLVKNSTVDLLAKMGFIYAEDELHYQMLSFKIDHTRGDSYTNRYEVSANNEEYGRLRLTWYKTPLDDRITVVVFDGRSVPVEWVS